MSFTYSARNDRSSRCLALALMLAGFASFCGRSSAADRFIVPVPDSSPSPAPSPSPPSSSSGSSSSESSSSSSSSSSSHSDSGSSSSHRSDNRFNVPVPDGRPSRNYGSGGSGHSRGSGWYDWYAAGCYYWDGRYYYGDGYYYSPFGEGIGLDRGRLPTRNTYPSSSVANRLPIFFPPVPPPLDTPSPAPPVGEPALAAPEELAFYVNDPFYAPLSTRLAERNLTDTLRRRLDAYQAAKLELLEQLQTKLAALSLADAATKESSLSTFAREQTPRLVALEATADDLRSDLLRGGLVGLLSGTGDWNEHRTWQLGTGYLARDGNETTAAKFRVARAAVFYQDGLSAAQRRLLREVAMELQAQAFKPPTTASPADDGLMFFSPDTARVRLPANLPASLEEKVTAYQTEKSALKSQLRETLFQQDRASKSARVQALKQLATAQAPRLAALEQRAEEIRRELAVHSNRSTALNAITLPPRLAARIAAYQKSRASLQQAIHSTLEEVSRILPPTHFKVVQNTSNPNGDNTLTLELRTAAIPTDRRLQVQQAIDTFNKAHRHQVAALARESDGVRADIAELSSTHPEVMRGKSVEGLLQEFTMASLQKDARPLYTDYDVAVFQPGLAPEQRRLLFGASVEKLALPLPGGEMQP